MRASPARGVLVGLLAGALNYEAWALLAPLLSICGGIDTTLIKGEAKVLSPEVNGVKVEVNVGGSASGAAQSPPGMDERAGQRGATEYEGRELKCRDELDGSRFCW